MRSVTIRWYHWLNALPIIAICVAIIATLWLLRMIRFHSKLEGLPIWLFTASDHLKRIWDLVPDGKIGGSRYIAQSLSVFIITAWLQSCVLKHELCHTKQIFQYGLLFPILYGMYWVINFSVNCICEQRVAAETFWQYLLRLALYAYQEIPFELEATRAETIAEFVI